jgi:hypothetical protein
MQLKFMLRRKKGEKLRIRPTGGQKLLEPANRSGKKRAASQRERPEFREETPVTRQEEDQPSSCHDGGSAR